MGLHHLLIYPPTMQHIISACWLPPAGKQAGRLKSVMMELRKCCNHPFLLEGQDWPVTTDPQQFLQQLVQASGKLALIDSMLARMRDRGHRVLIYSQFTSLLDLLEEWLTARQWGYQRIDGSVGGAERQSRIDQFNRRPADNFVFLLSTRAGGLGINLASADTVIIYDSDWNPHNDLQAQARAHRLGQLKPVMIYRLVLPLLTCTACMHAQGRQAGLNHAIRCLPRRVASCQHAKSTHTAYLAQLVSNMNVSNSCQSYIWHSSVLASALTPQPVMYMPEAWPGLLLSEMGDTGVECRLVTRLTIEERMMQQTKKKMVLEHLVVHKMNTAADLKQVLYLHLVAVSTTSTASHRMISIIMSCHVTPLELEMCKRNIAVGLHHLLPCEKVLPDLASSHALGEALAWLIQDELDDILRYGAAELFADAVAASQKAQQAVATGNS